MIERTHFVHTEVLMVDFHLSGRVEMGSTQRVFVHFESAPQMGVGAEQPSAHVLVSMSASVSALMSAPGAAPVSTVACAPLLLLSLPTLQFTRSAETRLSIVVLSKRLVDTM
jgi:hypothetical protein